MLRICDPIRNVDSADLLFLEMFNFSRNKNAFIEVLAYSFKRVLFCYLKRNDQLRSSLFCDPAEYYDGIAAEDAHCRSFSTVYDNFTAAIITCIYSAFHVVITEIPFCKVSFCKVPYRFRDVFKKRRRIV